MIIVKTTETARLGNLLFNIAPALTISYKLENHPDIYFINNIYTKTEYFNTVIKPVFFKNIIFTDYIDFDISDYETITGGLFKYVEIPIKDNIILEGHFQNYLDFDNDYIRQIYKVDYQDYIHKTYNDFFDKNNVTSIAVRRGDFLNDNNKQWFRQYPISYYYDAMKLSDTEKYFVVSDDLNWCKNNIKGDNIYYSINTDPLHNFMEMLACKNNIITNSTYSWWGAFLNGHKNKKVICPCRQYNNIHQEANMHYKILFPKNYTVINKNISKSVIITCTSGDFEYIDEWIEYHHRLGVNLFLIGYNGPSDKFRNYKQYDYVKYIDFSYNSINFKNIKNERYAGFEALDNNNPENDLYKEFRQNKIFNILLFHVKLMYQNIRYCMAIDIDEFIDIKDPDYNNINIFLEDYFPYRNSSISVKWNIYGDNNLIYNDGLSCINRFTSLSKIPIYTDYLQGSKKIIINMLHNDTKDIYYDSAHSCTKYIWNFDLPEDKIALKHFQTKTIEEWIKKMNSDIDPDYFNRFRGRIFYIFFKYNELTDEKIKAIPGLMKKYNIDYDIVKEEQDSEFKQRYLKIFNDNENE